MTTVHKWRGKKRPHERHCAAHCTIALSSDSSAISAIKYLLVTLLAPESVYTTVAT